MTRTVPNLWRLLGWLVLLAAAAVLVRDLMAWWDGGAFEFSAFGQVWFELSSSSLNLAQAVIQRYIHPALWDPVITTVLFWWATPVLLVLAGLLLYAGYRRR